MSASVNLPLHHKVQKFSSGTGSPGWSRKNGRRTVVCMCVLSTVSSKIYVHNVIGFLVDVMYCGKIQFDFQ